MGHWVGGRCVPCFGISGVAVAPEHRSRGVAGKLMRRALEDARDAGAAPLEPLPGDLPGLPAPPRRYESAGTRIVYRVLLSNLGLGASRAPSCARCRRASTPRFTRSTRRTRARSTGAIARTPYFWTRIFEPWSAERTRASSSSTATEVPRATRSLAVPADPEPARPERRTGARRRRSRTPRGRGAPPLDPARGPFRSIARAPPRSRAAPRRRSSFT